LSEVARLFAPRRGSGRREAGSTYVHRAGTAASSSVAVDVRTRDGRRGGASAPWVVATDQLIDTLGLFLVEGFWGPGSSSVSTMTSLEYSARLRAFPDRMMPIVAEAPR
jgi:hypothetical protein